MPVESLNASSLPEPVGFTHVSIATGTRVVFLAGQVAQNEQGEVVGAGDLAAQTEQALLNVEACLRAAGATRGDIAKVTFYVVDWDESKLDALFAGSVRAAERLGSASPVVATTLVPVPRLFSEEHLIEIDVTAVVA